MPIARVQMPDGRIGRFEVPDGMDESAAMDWITRNASMLPNAEPSAEAADLGAAIKASGPVGNKPDQSYSSSLFPVSRDARGNTNFDLNAGITGMLKRVVTAPGEALSGKLDPMSDEGIKRALEMASVISPVSTATRAGEMVIPGVKTAHTVAKPKIPTAAELNAAKDAAYNSVEKSGVEYSGRAIQDMIRGLKDDLTKKAAIAQNYPKTYALINELDNAPPGSSVQINMLDALRKQLGKVAGGDESFAAKMAIERLDKFIDAADPASLMARTPAAGAPGAANVPRIGGTSSPSPAEEAARLIKEARGNAAAGFRSDTITGIQGDAELRAAAANSGKNLGNAIRQRVAGLLIKDGGTRGYTPEEIAALESLVRGSRTANVTRDIGNLLGGGGGLGSAVYGLTGAVGAAADPRMAAIAALPFAGAASKATSNALSKSALNSIDDMIRMRSPLYQQRLANPQMEVLTPEMKAAIARMVAAGYFAPKPAWNPKSNEA